MENKVEINGVVFDIKKLGALRGFRLLERIRVAMASTEIPTDTTGSGGVAAVVKALMALPTAEVEHIRKELFDRVDFQAPVPDGGGLQPPIKLLGAEDMAFQDLEPFHMYEVLGRAFIVNFNGSWSEIKQKFPALGSLAAGLQSKQ